MTDVIDKSAQTTYPIHALLANRWSPRAFADKPIALEVIGSLLEAARWSASSNNKQPWAFIIATRDNSEAFEKMLSVIKEGNQVWAKNAPLLMLTVIPDERDIDLHDLGLAVQSLTTEALSRDLYVHQMGGIFPREAEKLYNVPDGYRVITGLAIGYLGDPADLPDNLRQREQATRSRKPFSEFVFEGTWAQPAQIIES